MRRPKRRRRAAWTAKFFRFGVPGLLLCLVTWIGVQVVFQSHYFEIRHLLVQDTRHISQDTLRATFAPVLGENLLRVDLQSVTQRALNLPWVQEVRIRRKPPDTLKIDVIERHREVAVESRGELYWVDATGVVLDPVRPGEQVSSYLIGIRLDGLMGKDPEQQRRLHTGLNLIRVVQAHPGRSDLPGKFVVDLEMGAEDPRLNFPYFTLRLGAHEHEKKWGRFLEIYPDLQSRGLVPEEIDLRFRDQIVVRTS